jgi:hypothetical protein
MKPEKAYEAVDNLIEGMDGAEQSQLFEHLRTTYSQQLGVAAVDGAGQETATQSDKLPLSAEQQEKAAKLTTAMAEKFDVPIDDFALLRTETEDGSEQLTVAYAADNGIDLGDSKKDYDNKRSWNSIFDKKATKNFMITVDGKKVDTRTGMTAAAYDSFIADARSRGIDPLPDSPQLADQNGEVWTDTWLTGEEAGRFGAPLGYVSSLGRVYRDRRPRACGYRNPRFRPAVVIE